MAGVELKVRALIEEPRMCRVQELAKSGSVISYSDIGDAQGFPVVNFTGLGGNRYHGLLWDEALKKMHLRLISVDRPGRGKTTPVAMEDLNVLDFADRVGELMDELGLGKFGVMAHSCGCLFAAGLVVRTPERVQGSVVLLAPWNLLSCPAFSWTTRLLRYVPGGVVSWAGSLMAEKVGKSAEAGFEDSFGQQLRDEMSDEERAFAISPRGSELSKQSMAIAMEEGAKKAMANDMLFCVEAKRRCDVRYEDVTCPVIVYHGEKDTLVPPACATWMKANMPHCRVVIRGNATHSIILNRTFIIDTVLPNFRQD